MAACLVQDRMPCQLFSPYSFEATRPMTWKHEGSRHERGYGYQWEKLRKRIAARDGYLCQPCLRQGRTTPFNEVDHIAPKSKDGTDDPDNLQAICTECHKAKTKAETSGKVRIGIDGWPI